MAARNNKDIAIRLSIKDEEVVRRALMSLGDDGQKALAKIERQSAPASKGLLAVNAVTGDLKAGLMGTASRLGLAGSALGALGPAGLAAAAAMAVAATAIVGLGRASIQAAREIAAIKDEAEQAGAAVETYQALQFAAENYSVSQEALTDGLKELNLRADEFVVTGGGSAAEAFKRLGFTQEDLQVRLKDTGELFLEVIKRTQDLDQAARIRIADEIFGGTGGEQFVRMVNAGEAAVRSLMEQARELGFVLDRDMIERADETRDKMAQLQRLIDLQLNAAMVDLAPVVLEVAGAFAEVAKWVSEVVDGFREIEDKSSSGLETLLEEKRAEAATLEQSIRDYQDKIATQTSLYSNNPAMVAATTGGTRQDIARARLELERVLQEIVELDSQLRARAQQNGATNTGTVTTSVGNTDSDQRAERIAKAISDLEFELDNLSSSDFDQKVTEKLRSLGLEMEVLSGGIVGFSDERAGRIYDLMRQIEQAAESERRMTEAQREGAAMTDRLRTAEEIRAASLAELQNLIDAGVISEETAARRRAEIAETYTREIQAAEDRRLRASTDAADGIRRAMMDIRDASQDAAAQWEQDIQGMNQTARNTFIDITTGAKSMADGLTAIFNDLQRRLMGRLFDKAAGTLFDGFLDGIFSSFHSGGVVGEATANRRVSPLVFTGAPRFHGGGAVGGLRPGEVPIVAERGERVLTEAQQDNTASVITGLAAMAMPKAPQVTVTVNNNAGHVAKSRAQSSQSGDGGIDLQVIIEEIESTMARNVAHGSGLAPTLEHVYGMDRAVGARR